MHKTFAVLTVLLLTTLTACPAFASTSTSFSLALSTNQIQFKIPAGTTFNGTITTDGMIRFWVTTPNGAQIINLGIINKLGSFRLVAQQNGTYTFNFENDLPNSIQVTFSYSADPPLPNGGAGLSSSYLFIVGVVAIAGSIVIIFVIRRKSKKVADMQRKMTQN